MKKFLPIVAASAFVLSSTFAHAATRPAPTEFQQPVAAESELGNEDDELGGLLLLGDAAILALIIILSGGGGNGGNSPR